MIAKPVISSNEEVVHETVKNKDGTTSVKTKVQKKQSSNTNRSSNSSSSNNNNKSSSGNSNSTSNSSSGSNKGSMTYEDDPKYHWEGDHSYGDGAEINGEDFDKLTGGDWKNWNY